MEWKNTLLIWFQSISSSHLHARAQLFVQNTMKKKNIINWSDQNLWNPHTRFSSLSRKCIFQPECDVPVPGIPGTGNFSFFWWYRNRYRNKLVPEKSLGTGIGKIWYRKKVSEPVSEKFGTGKSTGIGIENIWYRKKVSVSVSFKILGTVTHCSVCDLPSETF